MASRYVAVALAGLILSAAACGDADAPAEHDDTRRASPEPERDADLVLDASVTVLDAEADAGPSRRECPHPEEPSTGAFTKIYDPSVGAQASYINDHTFVRDDSGTWHLFGITHAEPANPFDEKTFAHATAPSLLGPWTKQPPALVANPQYGETLLWAPYVLHEGNTYYMFYCGGGADRAAFQIQLATSTDLVTWTREAAPLFKDGYDARDPMVLRVGNQWVLYYTANSAAAGGNHIVAYRTSTDLRHWGDRHVAFTDPTTGTFAGPTESPFVVARGGDYYLFIGPREGYAETAVFHSKDPLSFDPKDQIYKLASHAAEVVQDVDGKTYVSHSGWEQGGVHLTPLEWLPTACSTIDGLSYRATIETAPKAGLIELTAGGRNLVSSAFRRSGPYLGVGGFGTHAAGAAASVDVSPDAKRITLRDIAFQDQPVKADWTFCGGDDTLDQRLTWHVQSDLTAVREVALGLSTALAQVRDETHPNANGDFPGLGSWALFGDGSSSLIAAYAPKSAWREDNRWLSSTRATAAFQPLWSSAGANLAAGTYAGGLYRLAVSTKADDVDRAKAVAAALASAPPSCGPTQR